MSPLLVLGALYLLSRSQGAAPAWPTPKSPPPPRPPPPVPAQRPAPAQPKQPTARKAPARKPAPRGAQKPAAPARPPAPAPPPPAPPPPVAARPSSAPLPPPTPIRPVPPAPAPPQRLGREAQVLDAQRMLNALGARLVPDGLYGPKTRGAWQTLATKQGLVPDFVRTGPKSAAVDNDTYERIRTAAAAKGRGVVGGDGYVYIP